MVTRRAFLAALAAVPLARMLPDLAASNLASSGGPYDFEVLFPDNAVWRFAGFVCNKNGPVDLRTMSGVEDIFIRPTGATIIEAAPNAYTSAAVDEAVDAGGTRLMINGQEIADIEDITTPSMRDLAEFGIRRRGEMTFTLNFQPEH